MARAEFRFYEELNDLLAPERRKRDFYYECARAATVKNAIEALGVPHTEVELILVNGESVDFDHLLREGDTGGGLPPLRGLRRAPAAAGAAGAVAGGAFRRRRSPRGARPAAAHAGLRHPLQQRPGRRRALLRGDEANFEVAEDVAKRMYPPVIRSHRASVDQMAILEPVLSETVCATCLTIIREATDEAVRRGVPEAAARDFILGHLNVELAILFDQLSGVRMSDAANKAVERAKKEIFTPDWEKVFEREAIAENIRAITSV